MVTGVHHHILFGAQSILCMQYQLHNTPSPKIAFSYYTLLCTSWFLIKVKRKFGESIVLFQQMVLEKLDSQTKKWTLIPHIRYTIYLNNFKWGWRTGSSVKTTCYSCKWPRLTGSHRYGWLTTTSNSNSRGPDLVLACAGSRYTCGTHAGKHSYTWNFQK